MTHRTDKRLVHLVEEYYLRDLAPEEIAELQAGLDADPDLRGRFMDASGEEWLLHHVRHAQAAQILHFEPRHRQAAKFRRIAAAAAILLTMGTLYLSTRTEVRHGFSALVLQKTVVAKIDDLAISADSQAYAINEGRRRTLEPGASVWDGDYIVVPASSRMSLRYVDDGTRLDLAESTVFSVYDNGGAKKIRLTRGHLFAQVAKQQPDRPMRLVSKDAEAIVIGTSFELLVEEFTQLLVHSGCVRFINHLDGSSTEVSAGMAADTAAARLYNDARAQTAVHTPTYDETIHHRRGIDQDFIGIDPKRNLSGLLKFDLGPLGGMVSRATLRLRIAHKDSDWGGAGTLRIYAMPDTGAPGWEISRNVRTAGSEVAHYTGTMEQGKDLELEIDPAAIRDGMNVLVIEMDKGGDDFWFYSSEGETPPRLILVVGNGEQQGE